MPEISSLTRQKPTEAVIELGEGESISLSFDANKVTPYWVSETERRVNDRDMLSLPKALAEAILSWDVTDEGQPFPPSAANIAKLSFPVMGKFFEKIMEAAVPTSEEGNGSSATSSTQDTLSMPPPANPLNGPRPSPSPEPSVFQSPT